MKKIFNRLIALSFFALTSCGTYFNQPYEFEEARLGETTDVTTRLKELALPKEPVVVGVYKFRDQTGQYKPSEVGSSFSTAVTQGATTILVKALEDSKWFVPIERENLANLLNERNIIRSTRQEYRKSSNPNEPQLPPLLYAGILLEGGVVSYDSNIVTGGFGARYFGVGGSTQYRQDRITVYLRAVSTSSGKILKTVYVSKTILSQALDASLFKYVNFKRLLEVETGFTRNEPVQLAVTEAIEKAVESMIIEGIKDKLWSSQANEQETEELISTYENEVDIANTTELNNRFLTERRGKNVIEAAAGASLIDGDYDNQDLELNVRIGYKRYLNPKWNINFSYSKFNLKNNGILNEGFMSFDINAEYNFLPYDKVTPFIYGGFGSNAANYFTRVDPKVQYGLGVEYLIQDNIGLKIYGEQNLLFTDELDGIVAGKRNDFYYRFGVGVNIYLTPPENNFTQKRFEEKQLEKELKAQKRLNAEEMKEKKKAKKRESREAAKAAKEAKRAEKKARKDDKTIINSNQIENDGKED